jgi:hypothetical protein
MPPLGPHFFPVSTLPRTNQGSLDDTLEINIHSTQDLLPTTLAVANQVNNQKGKFMSKTLLDHGGSHVMIQKRCLPKIQKSTKKPICISRLLQVLFKLLSLSISPTSACQSLTTHAKSNKSRPSYSMLPTLSMTSSLVKLFSIKSKLMFFHLPRSVSGYRMRSLFTH